MSISSILIDVADTKPSSYLSPITGPLSSSRGKANLLYQLDEAIAHQQRGDLKKARPLYLGVLKIDRKHFVATYNLGLICAHDGEFAKAAAFLRKAIKLNTEAAEPHASLGKVLALQRRFEQAISHYKKALALGSDNSVVRNNLGVALEELNRHQEAIVEYGRALKMQPDFADAANNLGISLATLHKSAEAILCFEKALQVQPDHLDAHFNLGTVLHSLERYSEAVVHFERALQISPNLAKVHHNLGTTLHALRRLKDSEMHLEKALELTPNFAEALNNLGTVLQELHRSDEAVEKLGKAIALKNDYAEAHNNLGNVLMEIGRLNESERALERAISLSPRKTVYYRNLSNVRRFTAGDKYIAAMESLVRNEDGSFKEIELVDLHFALGKAFEDLGQSARSFEHFVQGNDLKRRQISYDEGETLGILERFANVFTAERFQRQPDGNPSSQPIFVIGMPRSGTTLIEQILASHPQVLGAGELTEFNDALTELGCLSGIFGTFLQVTKASDDARFLTLGTRYLESVRSVRPHADRFVDKMPSNFRFAGLIHLALPNARIIHVSRDPVDTCVSCFSKLFTGDLRLCGLSQNKPHSTYRQRDPSPPAHLSFFNRSLA